MKLTTAKLKAQLSKPGKYSDGGCLYFSVRKVGKPFWLFFAQLPGQKRREMSLGPYPDIGLAEARQLARDARAKVRAGIDPIEARKAEKAALMRTRRLTRERTFEAVAELYVVRHEPGWRSVDHACWWRSTLSSYVYPRIGGLDVAEIGRDDVLAALEEPWRRIPPTAKRLQNCVELIFDLAIARGWRSAPNPARWRDLRHDLPAADQLRLAGHHSSLPWQKSPEFASELRTHDLGTARALEFLILTVARAGEVTGATWREIDLDTTVWTIPGARMKGGRQHRVPLSQAALTVLERMRPLTQSPGDYLFPGQFPGRPMATMALFSLLRRMQGGDAANLRWVDAEGRAITVHGFRATFRSWASDLATYPREFAESALAHTAGSKVERAYVRGDLLEQRRPMMASWAQVVDGTSPTILSLATYRAARR